MKRAKALSIIRERLRGKRLLHSESTALLCERMAALLGEDAETAYVAGLLHDIAKPLSNRELLERTEKYKLQNDKISNMHPSLLHAPVGAALLEKKYKVDNNGIIEAVRCHTTGSAGMSLLAQIVYAADFLDPVRAFPKQEKAWSIMDEDFYAGLLYITRFSMKRVMRHWQFLHPGTLALYNEMLGRIHDKKREKKPLRGIDRAITLEIHL